MPAVTSLCFCVRDQHYHCDIYFLSKFTNSDQTPFSHQSAFTLSYFISPFTYLISIIPKLTNILVKMDFAYTMSRVTMAVDGAVVGLLIGRSGRNVQSLESQMGVKIQVAHRSQLEGGKVRVTVDGPTNSVLSAGTAIMQRFPTSCIMDWQQWVPEYVSAECVLAVLSRDLLMDIP